MTNPLTSTQVIEVGLLKPRCAKFQGNTLNDWLKWLAEKHCEIDWSKIDLTCIKEYLDTCDDCIQDQKVVINTLVQGVCKALQSQAECCLESEKNINLKGTWSSVSLPREPKYLKRGRLIIMRGAIQIESDYTSVMFTLPLGDRPKTEFIMPVSTSFPQSNAYKIDLRIGDNGDVNLLFTGTPPAPGTTRIIYLDGITFFTE